MKKSSTPLIKHIPDFLDYCDVVNGLSSKTIENYSRFLQPFINWLKKEKLDTTLPHQLSGDHVYKYRLFLSRQISRKDGKSIKKSTQNYYLIALRSLLSYFAKKDIQSLPIDKVSLAREKKVKKVNFLNLDQKTFLHPRCQYCYRQFALRHD